MSGTSVVPAQKPGTSVSRNKVISVYIWDMDETLILLKSLLNGSYAESFGGSKDIQKGLEIGKMWEKHILQICDDLFFYEQIEDYNEPYLVTLRLYDDGRDLSDYNFKLDELNAPFDDSNKRKLAYRHRAAAHRYSKGLSNILAGEMMNVLDELYNITDEYTDRWLSSARAFLEQCSCVKEDSVNAVNVTEARSETIHVLVTSGALIPSLVKCLLFRLDNFISHDNVYSSWEVGKLRCFKWIKERFYHPNFRFCVIGDGWEECAAAETMQWPFVKIDPQPNGCHRFPGLTPKTVGYYFDVIYGSTNADDDEE